MKKSTLFLLTLSGFLLAGCSFDFEIPSTSKNTSTNPNTGTTGETFIGIGSINDLKSLTNSNQSYKLTSDLDFSAIESWEPIEGFTGKLDGDNHKISNINLSFSTGQNIGLFSTSKGSFSNLTISGEITVTGEARNIGLLAGSHYGIMDNVVVQGKVNAQYSTNVGGLAGSCTTEQYASWNHQIKDCTNEAEIIGNTHTGGLFGYSSLLNKNIILDNLVNKGSVTGKNQTGGIFGFFKDLDSKSGYKLENLSNEGQINGSLDTGGLVGYAWKEELYQRPVLTITTSSNSGTVSGETHTGGLVGNAYYTVKITNSSNSGAVIGTKNFVGGIIAHNSDNGYGYSSVNNAENSGSITGVAYVGGIAGECYSIENSRNAGIISSSKAYLEGSALVSCLGGITGRSSIVNNCTNEANITVEHEGANVGGIAGTTWTSGTSSTFSNNINKGCISASGNNVGGLCGLSRHAHNGTSGDKVVATDNHNLGGVTGGGNYVGGLFGQIYNTESYAVHMNLSSSSNIGLICGGGDYVGGIAGGGNGLSLLSVSSNNKNIIANGNYIGGIVGSASNGTIKNCTNEINVEGKAYVGGIAGYAKAVDSCENKGTIKAKGYIVDGLVSKECLGGVVGGASAVTNCVNRGELVTFGNANRIGGIVGELKSGSGNNSLYGNKNYVNISATLSNAVGGIAGWVYVAKSSHTGPTQLVVRENENYGSITGQNNVGGIVGSSTCQVYEFYKDEIKINSCINEGDIIGTNYVGGILGYAEKSQTDSTVWSSNQQTGTVTGSSNYGNYYGAINV